MKSCRLKDQIYPEAIRGVAVPPVLGDQCVAHAISYQHPKIYLSKSIGGVSSPTTGANKVKPVQKPKICVSRSHPTSSPSPGGTMRSPYHPTTKIQNLSRGNPRRQFSIDS